MKVLFLTSRFPFPPVGGDKLRVCTLLKSLSLDYSVTLFALSDKKVRGSELTDYGDYCSRIEVVYLPKYRSYLRCLAGLPGRLPLQVYYYRTKEMGRLISKEINSFDLVFVHLIRMAEYVKNYQDINKVIDFTDAISLNYQRSIRYQRGFRYLISLVERKRVLRYETDIINCFDKSFFVSEVDKAYIERYTDAGNIDVIPVGVDTDYFSYSDSGYEANEIVFVGNMRTYPNSDAAYYFAEKIFPRILQKLPDARFTIAGAYPTRRIRSLNGKGNIFVTGRVKDIRPYLKRAAVSVCPMRTGAGVQNKVIESMSSGTPVVTSLIGSEGIGAVSGRDILIAENEQDFAEKVTVLMTDKNLRDKISLGGRKFVEEKFADSVSADKFQRLIAGFQNK